MKKILIVEDNQVTLKLLNEVFKKEGYQVEMISEGANAVEKIMKMKPDIILMDILLPDVDGASIAKTLQNNSDTKDIPLIFLSGIIEKEIGQDQSVIKIGERNYRALGKPITTSKLLQTIKEVI